MTPTYLEELADRALAICKATIEKSEGVTYFIYTSTNFPYFTMRLGQDDLSADNADMESRAYTLIIRYVIGHLTSNYNGQNEKRLYRDIPALEDAFAQSGLLQSTKFPQPMNVLDKAFFTLSRGLTAFQTTGLNVTQVGTEFNLRAEFTVDTPTKY
jgi:hypothetical protein